MPFLQGLQFVHSDQDPYVQSGGQGFISHGWILVWFEHKIFPWEITLHVTVVTVFWPLPHRTEHSDEIFVIYVPAIKKMLIKPQKWNDY